MHTIEKKQSGASIDWNFDDPKVRKGLARLLRDLQAMMTEDQFQEILLRSQRTSGPAACSETERTHPMPIVSHQSGGDADAIIPQAKSRKKAARHAA